MLAVRRLAAGDVPALVTIVRGLPDYFTDDVAEKVERDTAGHDTWVLADAGDIAGFAVVARKSAAGAEILWMAIDPVRRGRGHGTALLGHVLDDLATSGVAVVLVKTLDRCSDYVPYRATRAFWERRGFVQVATIDPLPGWQPGNPAGIYAVALRPTRT